MTNAAFNFFYSDDVHLCSVVRPSDSDFKTMMHYLQSFLSQIHEPMGFNYLVTKFIIFLDKPYGEKYRGVKMIEFLPDPNDKSLILQYTIRAVPNSFERATCQYAKCLHFKVWIGEKIIFDDLLSNYSIFNNYETD